MRDPERIDKILAQLGELWKKYPDLRLGQLVGNTGIQQNELLFYNIEDQELINYILEYYNSL